MLRVLYVLSLALSWLAAGSLQAQDIDTLVSRIAPSVVGIGAIAKNLPQRGSEGPARFFGSGFAVAGGQQVVTNWHVVQNQLGDNEILVVFAGKAREVKAYPAQISELDELHDLALLELAETAGLGGLPLADSVLLSPGRAVAFTGYPTGMLGGVYPVSHRGMISALVPAARPVRSAEKLSARALRAQKSGYMTYQIDGEVLPGHSGSPVYDIDQGKVVAIVQGSLTVNTPLFDSDRSSRVSYAIPVRYLIELLER